MSSHPHTLWQLPVKQVAQVTMLVEQLSQDLASRLRQMGFTPGQAVTCIRRSPFRGPIVIQLGDCVYSLEQQVAETVLIADLSA